MKRALPPLIAILAFASPCAAEVVTQKSGNATLDVYYQSQKGGLRTLELPDLIQVILTVEGSASLETPIAPLELPSKAPWMLVERTRPTRKTLPGDRRQWQITYRFAPREPGEAVPFEFPEVKFKDGEQHTASWQPTPFAVQTKITSPNVNDLKDITSIEEVPPAIERVDWLQIVSLFMAACVLGFALTMYVRSILNRAKARSNAMIALHELDRLIALNLPEHGRSERFITLLTTLVRRYLERQYAIPARRRTTLEFLAEMDRHPKLKKDQKQFLAQFLDRCEIVKFADVEMSAEECAEWADRTKQFLQSPLAA